MFLFVSVRHVGAHPSEHQHGVSIQISTSLSKTFLRISRMRNIPLPWLRARDFVYVRPFISQILDFIYWTVLIFIWSILNGVTLKTSNKCCLTLLYVTWIRDFFCPWDNRALLYNSAARLLVGNNNNNNNNNNTNIKNNKCFNVFISKKKRF